MTNPERNLISIRVATTADAAAITDVINRAFRSAENFFVKGDRLDQTEVDRLLSTGTFLLAEAKNVMLGCVYVEPKFAVQSIRAYLGLLSVDPDQQGGGIGSKLMDAAEDHCRKLGCAFMDIHVVNLRKELPGFYHRRGYVETGTSEFPPEVETKIPCHFIEMSKDIWP